MIGKILGNRYEILEKIGTGGMGDVYKAHCRRLDRIVAIKVLKSEYNDDNNFIRKFKRESLAAASISHPNIVSIYDVGSEEFENDKIHYIVMEYIDGRTLKEVINEEGKLSEKRALNYCVQIAEALKVAHSKNIVHRDIKSQNIMVTKDDRVKVTDFGIARVADNSTVTATNAIMGSVHYFSPEQARGAKVDNRSDIYSLGIVLYEMLTGNLPFDAENPVSVALMQVQSNMPIPSDTVREISSSTDQIVLKMTMKDPDDRYSDVYKLITDIKNVQLGKSTNLDYTSMTKQTIPLESRVKDNSRQKSVSERGKKVVRRSKNENITENEEYEVPVKKKKKKSILPVVLGVITALLLVVLIVYVVPRALFNSGNHNQEINEAQEIKVPNIVGKTEDEARQILKAQKLEMNISGNDENENYKDREVLSQSPSDGEIVKEGTSVNVVINSLPDSVKIPDFTNKTLQEAQDLSTSLGLKIVDIQSEFNDSIEDGKIISQDPLAGSEVIKDKNIKLVVSKGVDNSLTTVPNLIGISKEDAVDTLKKLGFKYTIEEKPNNTVEKGEIFDYSPKNKISKQETITLYVSDGKDTSSDNMDTTDSDSSNALDTNSNSTNSNEVSTTFNVRVPDDGQRHRIVVKRYSGDRSYVLFDYHKTSDDGDVKVPVHGKRGDKVEIYVDDNLAQNQNI